MAAQVAQVLTVWHWVHWDSVHATQAVPSCTWPLGHTHPSPAELAMKVAGHTHRFELERTNGDAQVWQVDGVAQVLQFDKVHATHWLADESRT